MHYGDKMYSKYRHETSLMTGYAEAIIYALTRGITPVSGRTKRWKIYIIKTKPHSDNLHTYQHSCITEEYAFEKKV